MSGINKVICIGRLGKDPEIRYSSSGTSVANISLAVSETWKDKNTGEKVDKTEWINAVAFKRTAEIIGEYLQKGALIYIEGKLQTTKYEKNGQDHYITQVVIHEMQMLGTKGESKSPAKPEPKQDPTDFDDDIPF